jgi:hypothetical protein
MDKTLEDEIAANRSLFKMSGNALYSEAAVRRAVEMAIRRAAEVCWQAGTQMSPSKQAGSDEAAAAILKLLD